MAFSRHDRYVLDLSGQRDEAWNQAFGLAREAARVTGYRCLSCGRRLWGKRRRYCDPTCRRRWGARRERYVAALREIGHDCPLCGGFAPSGR